MSTTYLILIMAIFSLLAGLSIYIWLALHSNHRFFYTTTLISWLLIALFPVMLIFSFFPESSASGNIFGFSLAGAFGAFVLIWWRGIILSFKADDLDTLKERIRDLENDLQEKTKERRAPLVLQEIKTLMYQLQSDQSKKIGLVTGGIELQKIADVWISSENTNMEISRFYENSISGVIRYYGAKKDQVGNIIEDVIANELTQVKGSNLYVQPATVLVTGSGELQATHGVKKIFHIASVQGEVGAGYTPIKNIHLCVTNALGIANSAEMREAGIKSILFPLLGIGTAKGDLQDIAQRLIHAAISYFEITPHSLIECAYFLAWTDIELEACQNILQQSDRLKRLG